MKRKVRISKPCMECGGSVPHMNAGGVDPRTVGGENPMQSQIQNPMKESAVGMCTGTNFGGPNCPKGSQQYEIALKFRKEEALQKKKEVASVAEQGASIDTVTGKQNTAFKDHIARNATNVIAEEEMIRAITQPQHQMPDGTMMPGAQHMSRYGGVPEFVVGGNMGPQTEQQWNDSNEFAQAKYDQQFGTPMGRIEKKPVVTDVQAIIDAGQFGDQSGKQQGLANDTPIAKTILKRTSAFGDNLKKAFGPQGLALDAIAQFGENRTEPDFAAMMDATTHADQAFMSNRDVDRGAIGFNDFGLARGADDFGVAQFKGQQPRNISRYGGVPKFETAGQIDFGYRGNPLTNELIQAQKEKEQGNQIWGQMATNFANADWSDRWKAKTKLIDNPDDGVDVKGWYKTYDKAYKKNYNNAMDNDMFNNMFAKMMTGGQLPRRGPGGPGESTGNQMGEHWSSIFAPFTKRNVQDMFGYDDSMARRAEAYRNTPAPGGYDRYGRLIKPEVVLTPEEQRQADLAAEAERVRQDLAAAERGRIKRNEAANIEAARRGNDQGIFDRRIHPENYRPDPNNPENYEGDDNDIAQQEGADAIEESRRTSSSSGSGSGSADTPATTTKEEEVIKGNYTPPEEGGNVQTTTDANRDVRFITPRGGQAPIATDYNYLSKINMRANPFRRKGHQRVKSYEFTHGIRGANGPAYGGGAGSFDPNNLTPEQMAMVTNMLSNKNLGSDDGQPLSKRDQRRADRAERNISPEEIQEKVQQFQDNDASVRADYDPDAPDLERVQSRGPQIDERDAFGDTWTPQNQANVDASYMEKVPVPAYTRDPRIDREAQEAYDANQERQAMLAAEAELDADLAGQMRYGGDAMYNYGGPEGGYGTPGYGIPDVTPQAASTAPWFEQDQASMVDAMRNRPISGPSNVDRANELMLRRPQTTMEFENRQRANMFAPTKQYGGDTMFQEGGEYDMTPDQVAAFLQAGGQIEYI